MNYFRMSSLRPAEPVGVIRVWKPIRNIGPVIDVDGNEWDIRAVTGGGVTACRKHELHPYCTDTSGQGYGGGGTTGSGGLTSQEWQPYRVEMVKR